jgi:predicted nucleic acid-binding protein
MRYLVDSDVMIDYLTNRLDSVALLKRLFPNGLAVSILTYLEVYQGISRIRSQDNSAVFDRHSKAICRPS